MSTHNETPVLERFTLRAATLDDAPAVADLVNRCTRAEDGDTPADTDSIRSGWQRPDFNLATDTRLVHTPDGDLVAFAGVSDRPPHVMTWSWVRVHPDYKGQGLGTELLAWTEARARESVAKAPPEARVVVRRELHPSNAEGQHLVTARGYERTRFYWRMSLDLDQPVPDPAWPDGITVRLFDREQDLLKLVQADKEAFSDHYGYVDLPTEKAVEHFNHYIDTNPHVDTTLWFLAMDGDEIAGFSLCEPKLPEDPEMAYVGDLAVRRAWRRRGIALALLRHSFQAFQARGSKRASLHVDAASLTGATRLYEKAGMAVDREYHEYTKELRPGVDLSTTALDE